VEVESGKVNARPQLQKALQTCRVNNATLIVGKMDRLSRNAAFLLTLRDAGVKFVAADLPNANELTVGILAVVAEDERRRISERTKAALAEAKKAGKRLGNPNGARALLAAGKRNTAAVAALKARADQRANDLAETIADIEAKGIQSSRGIARELNRREIPTPQGKAWSATTVIRVRNRAHRQAH